MYFYDIHTHIYPDTIAERASQSIASFYEMPVLCGGTADELLRRGTAAGIRRFVIHSVAVTPNRVESVNRFLAEAAAAHPDEFIGFGSMHPDFERIGEEADRMLALGLHGVKVHPDFQHFAPDDPRAIRMFRIFAERNMPVILHAGDTRYDYSTPERLARMLDKVPNMKAVCAHLGGYTEWRRAWKLLAGRDNLWTDTSSSLAFLDPQEAADIIRRFGTDRVLYGTDYPMWTPEEETARFLALPLTDAEKETIAHENIRKLLPGLFESPGE